MAGLLPFVGPVMQGVGGLIGAFQAHDAARKQLALQKQQMEQQQVLAGQQLKMAQDLQRQGLATQVDGEGNYTFYDPTSNTWRSVLSQGQQQLQNQSDKDQLAQLGVERTTAQNEAQVQAQSRSADALTRDALDAQAHGLITGQTAADPNKLASAIALSRQAPAAQAVDAVKQSLATQNLRQGATGTNDVGSSLAKALAAQLGQNAGNPAVEAQQYAQEQNSGGIQRAAGVGGQYAARAAAVDQGATGPIGLSEAQRGGLLAARQAAMSGTQGAAGITTNAAQGLRATPPPDYSMGGSIGGLAAGLGNLGSKAFGALFGGMGGTAAGTAAGTPGISQLQLPNYDSSKYFSSSSKGGF